MANRRGKSRVDPVEVYCRIRPLAENENGESCLKLLDEFNLMLQMPECSASFRTGQIKQLVYSFTKIFNEQCTQKHLFDQVGQPLVDDLQMGRNGLLFTYGVTGSGKTFSMIGNQSEHGLLQRSLDALFDSISQRQTFQNQHNNKKLMNLFKPDRMNSYELNQELLMSLNSNSNDYCAVFISCVEIYNNYIYDLLDESAIKESKYLKEDSRGCMYIKDMAELQVRSSEEALDLLQRAQKRRVVAYTDLNAESSRSHSIFTIRFVQLDQNMQVLTSQLSLVDLAGSERTKRTKNTGSRLKEAGSINSSLMALRNCMETLRENISNSNGQRKMVPYRDSKLTLLFKNYFEGNGKIKMILCINPSSIEFDETINVLKFSDLVKDILLPTADIRTNNQISASSALKISYDTLEQANLQLLSNLQRNNYAIMNENFPPMDIFSPDDDVTIRRIIEYLEEFQRKRDAIIHETDQLKQMFYHKLKEINDDFDTLRDERNEYKSRLEQKERDMIKSDSKIRALEKIINTSSFKTPMHSHIRTPMPSGSSTHSTNDKSSFASSTNETPSVFRSTQRVTANARAAMFANNPLPPAPPPPLPPQTPSSSALSNRTNSSSSNRFQTPQRTNFYQQQYLQNIQASSTIKEAATPIGNRRAQRRSKSAEMWLDHRPPNSAKIDTVLQPKMERKKSVSKLELSDTKKSSKYVLTHQQQDEDGEVVTNLIKGNIFQSPSGGANVIFTDVETLHVSEAPKPVRKRPSEDHPIGDRLEIEDRCAIAIEGHMSSSAKIGKIVKKTKI